jgi:DNA-directed RNA polymerase, mitochondrial
MSNFTKRRQHLRDLRYYDISTELKALNALQKTQWRINYPVLLILEHCWKNNSQIGKLPPKENLPLPKYPFGDRRKAALTEEELPAYKKWASRQASIHEYNATNGGKRLAISETISMAHEYSMFGKFYFVWNGDFRQRKYPLSVFLSPQSAEWSKALLEFARPAICKNTQDVEWLAIHGANVFGNDKMLMEDRIKWAYSFSDEAVEVYKDPLANVSLWSNADKPFSFLAWCFEWGKFVTDTLGNGEDSEGNFIVPFETRLPCAADGTANGIQHLSAILRDEKGAKAVNLISGDKPSDIYADVAAPVEKILKKMAANPEDPDNLMAKSWLEFGINRKITKRSVMIVPYSGTQQACRKYIEEAYHEGVENGKPDVFGDKSFAASLFLVKHVWNAIGDVIVASKVVMNYIKEIATCYNSVQKAMEWVTPNGMLIRPLYFDTSSRLIKTQVSGKIMQLKMVEDNEEKIDCRKTRTSSAPNFIHSLDACAMTRTVNVCSEDGIEDLAMIHDSFGTHSPNMYRLGRILREQFVEMYLDHDVLQELRDHAIKILEPLGVKPEDIPEVPLKGSLDILQVLDSVYFFS